VYGQDIIVRYLQDAEAAERTFEDTLASFSKTADQPAVQSALASMSLKARSQHERLEARLQALGAARSAAKSALAHALGLVPILAQTGETTARKGAQDLMIAIAAAAADSAMYEALAAAAAAAGDLPTERLARQLQEEERQNGQEAAMLLRQSAIHAFQSAMNENMPQPPAGPARY
jgi:ferritin-like metal-binding protein YciE